MRLFTCVLVKGPLPMCLALLQWLQFNLVAYNLAWQVVCTSHHINIQSGNTDETSLWIANAIHLLSRRGSFRLCCQHGVVDQLDFIKHENTDTFYVCACEGSVAKVPGPVTVVAILAWQVEFTLHHIVILM